MLNSRSEEVLSDILADSIGLITPTELELVKRLKLFEEQRCYKTYIHDELKYLEYLVKGREREPEANDALSRLQKAMSAKLNAAMQTAKLNNWVRQPVNKEHIEEIMKERKIRQIKAQKETLQKQLYRINRSIEKTQFHQQQKDKEDAESPLKSPRAQQIASRTTQDVTAIKEEQQRKTKEIHGLISQLQKEKLERKRKIEESLNAMSERQNQKRQEELQREKQMLEERRKQILDRKKRMEELHEKERAVRSQHELTYAGKISKAFSEEEQLRQMQSRRRSEQEQLRKKLITRREKLNLQPLDTAKLDEHTRRYEQHRKQEQEKRQQRLKLQQQEAQHQLVKHYSSYEQRYRSNDSNLSCDDSLEPLRNKVRRIRDYEALVRSRYKPRIDESKRKELQNQIEELELGGRHIRRSRLENGSILFEEIHRSDPKIIGLQYLQEMKKLVEKTRSQRRSEDSMAEQELAPRTDYLAELRQKNKRKMNFSAELDRLHSYEQKVSAVQHRTDVLMEQAKRKEKLLKHGKFLTPQQILQYKEELDDQYLDIINLKLKLIQ